MPRKNSGGNAANLIAALVEQNAKDAAWTANTLIESYRQQAIRAESTLAAIRDRVGHLLSGDYMPTSTALIRALYPSEELIRFYSGEAQPDE